MCYIGEVIFHCFIAGFISPVFQGGNVAMMKKIIICVVFLAILVGCSFFQESIVFGDIKWQYHGGENSNSTLILRNKKIIGPYNISLWGEYPYIVGDCVIQEAATLYFVVDVKTGDIEYHKDFDSIRQKYKINFDYRDFVTFQDLHGQWSKPEKLDILKKNLSIK